MTDTKLDKLKDHLSYNWYAYLLIGGCIVLFIFIVVTPSPRTELENLIKNHDCKGLKVFGEQHQQFMNDVLDGMKLEGCSK